MTPLPDIEVVAGAGVFGRLAEFVDRFGARRVLVVASTGGLRRTAVAGRLAGAEVATFTGFRPNPDLADLREGARVRARFRPDLVVGIGGGSAMDAAKAVAVLPPGGRGPAPSDMTPADYERGRDGCGLVLVPTTAGSGAEVTRFASVYVDGRKQSLDHHRVRADVALVDPELTAGCSRATTISGAWDALAHALESLWSVRSSVHSRLLASEAAAGVVTLLSQPGVLVEPRGRAELSRLATMAGLAIDLTRTTLAHAFAYPLTARAGIRHGVACALNLVWVFAAAGECYRERCTDPRGPGFVAERLRQVAAIVGAGSRRDIGAALADLMRAGGLADRLGAHGVRAADLPHVVADGTSHERAGNSPVALADGALDALRARL
ncbi:phosphonoacetaldehyde reductase [Actinophytocola sp. KF-1]